MTFLLMNAYRSYFFIQLHYPYSLHMHWRTRHVIRHSLELNILIMGGHIFARDTLYCAISVVLRTYYERSNALFLHRRSSSLSVLRGHSALSLPLGLVCLFAPPHYLLYRAFCCAFDDVAWLPIIIFSSFFCALVKIAIDDMRELSAFSSSTMTIRDP